MTEPAGGQIVEKAALRSNTFRFVFIAIFAVVAVFAIGLANGRAIEQYLFGYSEIHLFFLNHTKLPVEAVRAVALLVWGFYTVVFTVLSYSTIARLFVGSPNWRAAAIAFLAISAQVPLLLLQAWLHESPTPIKNLSDLQCFDTRTKGRVIVWYYKAPDGAVTLFENGYDGSWKGRELLPATQEICDLAQARWEASERAARKAADEKKAVEEKGEKERKAAAYQSPPVALPPPTSTLPSSVVLGSGLSHIPPPPPPDPRYRVRREVPFSTQEEPGTIIVNSQEKHLYYVLGGGRAISYVVSLGSNCSSLNGRAAVTEKEEWPDWKAPFAGSELPPSAPLFMAGGPGNPLGARSLRLGNTAYSIHGTNHPSMIGEVVSLGCIGMYNEDVSDIFDRAKIGTTVLLR